MSRLAPGRQHDMAMLLDRQASAIKYSPMWDKVQLKIDDLIEEGKCRVICAQRERLVKAAKASDHEEIIKISKQIDQHMKLSHRRRWDRAWLKKG